MDYRQLLESLTPEMYEGLKRAVELGKWPDGRRLSPEQRELCLQAVIAYDNRNRPAEERTGYIPPREHSHCGGSGEVAGPDGARPLKWREPS